MADALSSTAFSGAPVSWLPRETLLRVLHHLSTPLDLYRASLVSRDWRSATIDPHLWQPFYWSFFRAKTYVETDTDRALQTQRERIHIKAMRAWVDGSRNSAPPSPLGSLCQTAANGASIMHDRLGKLVLMVSHMRGGAEFFESTIQCVHEIVASEYGPRGPTNAKEATDLISLTLIRESGKTPTQDDFNFAEASWPSWRQVVGGMYDLQRGPRMYPRFLSTASPERGALQGLPDFYDLFVKRLNEDDQLLRDLNAHVKLERGILDNLLRLIERYRAGAQDLLIALAAQQQLTSQAAEGLLKGGTDSPGKALRALAVHSQAATGSAQPDFSQCIALRYTALQLLGHLQRREAVRSMQQLYVRFSPSTSPTPTERSRLTLKDPILRSCVGIEEALTSLASFSSGEPTETSSYLDLLSLYVWAEQDASRRWRETDRINPELTAAEEDSSLKSTTRDSVMGIDKSLRGLGFRPAEEHNKLDLNNFFLNVSTLCPAQRAIAPLVFCALLCAVCRRLGIAATLANAPTPVIMVIEDGAKPLDFPEDEEGWARFYIIPLPGKEVPNQRCIFTTADMAEHLATHSPHSATVQQLHQEINGFLEPASPLTILADIADEMLRAVRLGQRSVARARGDEGGAPFPSADSAINDQLALLREYLCGGSALPPWPLAAAVLPPSLPLLPPTKAMAKRFNSPDLPRLAHYAALLTLRMVDPERDGGAERADEILAGATAAGAIYCCDLAILLEIHGADVQKELELARRQVRRDEGVAEEGEDDRDWWEEALTEGPQAPYAVRAFVVGALSVDRKVSKGLGGEGAGDSKRDELELLDPAHPRNAEVQHPVGTVFTHRQTRRRGVVIGWDACYKGPENNVSVVSPSILLVIATQRSPADFRTAPSSTRAGHVRSKRPLSALLPRIHGGRLAHVRRSIEYRRGTRPAWSHPQSGYSSAAQVHAAVRATQCGEVL